MEREILAYIKQNRMIGKNDVVLAGVSGGSDSLAMLRILKELQGKLDFTLRVVHIPVSYTHLDVYKRQHLSDVCVCCGKPAKKMVYWGRAY